MTRNHFVRIGPFGHVGCFTSVDAVQYPRGSRVICRTSRGLEVGAVLSHKADGTHRDSDGALLRGVTVEDELLISRLEKNRDAAFAACSQMLAERHLAVTLVDVEHLFDGRSLYFYFLGQTTPELETLTAELADTYEANVEFHKFAETLVEGCGPGCGTEEAAGQGCTTGGCSVCAASSVCHSKSPT